MIYHSKAGYSIFCHTESIFVSQLSKLQKRIPHFSVVSAYDDSSESEEERRDASKEERREVQKRTFGKLKFRCKVMNHDKQKYL